MTALVLSKLRRRASTSRNAPKFLVLMCLGNSQTAKKGNADPSVSPGALSQFFRQVCGLDFLSRKRVVSGDHIWFTFRDQDEGAVQYEQSRNEGKVMTGSARKSRNRRIARSSTQRLEARVSAEQKLLFQRAAALRGVSLTDFMIESMREAAVETVEKHDRMRLTAAERRLFVEALLNPPAPNEALRSATKRYYKMIGAD